MNFKNISKHKDILKNAVFIWILAGFCAGMIESIAMREDTTYIDGKVADTSTSGCVYQSYSALINPGHLLGCELFRRRFNMEGFGKK